MIHEKIVVQSSGCVSSLDVLEILPVGLELPTLLGEDFLYLHRKRRFCRILFVLQN